jgi:DNA-binding NarL/FixJ family response regulator
MTPTGVGTAPLASLNSAIQCVRYLLYWNIPLPEVPLTDKHISLSGRNRQICERCMAGETLEEIARDLGLSHQRVHQSVRRWCSKAVN